MYVFGFSRQVNGLSIIITGMNEGWILALKSHTFTKSNWREQRSLRGDKVIVREKTKTFWIQDISCVLILRIGDGGGWGGGFVTMRDSSALHAGIRTMRSCLQEDSCKTLLADRHHALKQKTSRPRFLPRISWRCPKRRDSDRMLFMKEQVSPWQKSVWFVHRHCPKDWGRVPLREKKKLRLVVI